MSPEDAEGLRVWVVGYAWLCGLGSASGSSLLPRSLALSLASLALLLPACVDAENALWRSVLAFAFSFCEWARQGRGEGAGREGGRA